MRRATRAGPDLIVHGHGSNYLLRSNSEFGRDWISDHIPEDAMTFGQGIVVKRRYIAEIIEAAGNDGNVIAVLIIPRDLAHRPNVCRNRNTELLQRAAIAARAEGLGSSGAATNQFCNAILPCPNLSSISSVGVSQAPRHAP